MANFNIRTTYANDSYMKTYFGITTSQAAASGFKEFNANGGIKDMGGVPDILVVIDTNKEDIAVLEACKLGIPVVAVVDSNCDPELITYPIPGNDDAIRAVSFYCDLFSRAIIDGLQQELAATGADIGEALEAPIEEIPAKNAVENVVAEAVEQVAEVAPEAPEAPDAETQAESEVDSQENSTEVKAEDAPTANLV